MAEKITYWQFHPLLRTWVLKTGDDGCELCTDENVQLSMSRPPPALRDQPAPPRKESALMAWSDKQRLNDPYDNVFEGIAKTVQACRRFNTWLDNPPHAARKATPSPKKEEIPNFDISEIPGVLKRLGMPKGAAIMEKWFKGELNYSPTDREARMELNQYGLPYPESMVDTKSISIDWVLSFPRAKEASEELKSGHAFKTANAIGAIQGIARRSCYKNQINAWQDSNENIQELHRNFQFQFAFVEKSLSQRFNQYTKQLWSAGGIPDDLSFALGTFNIYAAIAHAYFTTGSGKRFINITHIYLYVRDFFSFADDPTRASQYLGHWSKKGIAIVLLKQATAMSNIDWVDVPTLHKTRLGLSFMYPIKNSDFRKWQLLHKQGGDYFIYTDKRIAKLTHPISIEF